MSDTYITLSILVTLFGCFHCGPLQRQSENAVQGTRQIRVKRLDFTMFGCECHPYAECYDDARCHTTHGRNYECKPHCCALRCVVRQRDEENNNGSIVNSGGDTNRNATFESGNATRPYNTNHRTNNTGNGPHQNAIDLLNGENSHLSNWLLWFKTIVNLYPNANVSVNLNTWRQYLLDMLKNGHNNATEHTHGVSSPTNSGQHNGEGGRWSDTDTNTGQGSHNANGKWDNRDPQTDNSTKPQNPQLIG